MKRKTIDIITYVILAVLIIFTLLVFLPKIFGYSALYVEAQSMEPTIKKGDMVLIEEVEFEDIKAGDVITFRNSDNTKRCTHRVVEIDNENRAFVTKGDNNNIKDPYSVGYEYVIGRVKISLPLAGYIFGLFDTPAARITAVILAVIYVSCEIELYRIKRKERDEK